MTTEWRNTSDRQPFSIVRSAPSTRGNFVKCGDCGRQIDKDAKRCPCGWVTAEGKRAQAEPKTPTCERCGYSYKYMPTYMGRTLCSDCYGKSLRPEHKSESDRIREKLIASNPEWQRQPGEDNATYAARMLARTPSVKVKGMKA